MRNKVRRVMWAAIATMLGIGAAHQATSQPDHKTGASGQKATPGTQDFVDDAQYGGGTAVAGVRG